LLRRFVIQPVIDRQREIEEIQPVLQEVSEQAQAPVMQLQEYLPTERREIVAEGQPPLPMWRTSASQLMAAPLREISVAPPQIRETVIHRLVYVLPTHLLLFSC
jgi:hypothetical protein